MYVEDFLVDSEATYAEGKSTATFSFFRNMNG
jgi:hypothetical protein